MTADIIIHFLLSIGSKNVVTLMYFSSAVTKDDSDNEERVRIVMIRNNNDGKGNFLIVMTGCDENEFGNSGDYGD